MKPALTLIDMTAIAQTATAAPTAPPARRADRIRFCTRCGTTTDEPDSALLSYGFDRVCDRCGMGVMLTGPQKALPSPGAAFVVVTREGRITAVSEAAERLLGEEPGLLDTPVTSSVTSPDGDDQFVRTISRAAGGGREVTEVRIVAAAPAARRLGPLHARIASCGPPRAALLVLERAPA
jgi:PAS domain-containing protein